MKKILLILSFAFLVAGCAAVKQAKQDMYSCLNDQACLDQAVAKSDALKQKVGTIANVVSPVPWGGVAAQTVTGGVALLAFLIAGGKKKRESEKP